MEPLEIPTPRIYLLTDKDDDGRYATIKTTNAIPFAEDPRFFVAFHPVKKTYAVYLDVVGTKFSKNSHASLDQAIDDFNKYRETEGPRMEKYIKTNWAIHLIRRT